MRFRIPKYLIGSDTAGEETTWVIQAHNPLIVAKVILKGLESFRLECWSPADHRTIDPADITKMAELFVSDVEEFDELPRTWEYVFNKDFEPPSHLVCDSVNKHFTAVLRTQDPGMWLKPHQSDPCRLIDAQILNGDNLTPEHEAALNESWRWWLKFCQEEEQIIESELEELEEETEDYGNEEDLEEEWDDWYDQGPN